MCKGAFWALAVATGLVGAGYFLGFGSHMCTAVHSVAQKIKGQIPPEFEIDRIRHELDQIDGDLASNFDALAHETVAVRHLRDDISDAEVRLEKQKKVVLTLRHDVDGNTKKVVYGGVEYTANELKNALTREFEAYKRGEAAIQAKKDELKARQESLSAGRAKIDEMRTQKETLGAELANLEAQYKKVQVTNARSQFQVDDSRLGNIKKSMKDLKDRIETMKLRQEMQVQFTHESIVDKVEQKSKANEVLKEVDAHFGNTPEKVVEGDGNGDK
jgi:chromosome segregation ATPase